MKRKNAIWKRTVLSFAVTGILVGFSVGRSVAAAAAEDVLFPENAFVSGDAFVSGGVFFSEDASGGEDSFGIKTADGIGKEALGLTEAVPDNNFSEWQSPFIENRNRQYRTAEGQAAVVVGSNLVNVRTDAGTSFDRVTQLVRYQPVTILGDKQANGVVWYRIGFTRNGVYEEGYMHSSYIMKTTPLAEGDSSDAAFEEQISAFPESYKPTLRGLHKIFPGWRFEPVLTGLSWNDVVAEEYVIKRNLVPNTSAFSWKSVRDGDYDWETGSWISHDASWVGASKEAVAYYLDPRNFLTADSRISQFETLSYAEGVQNKSGLEAILKNSFMANDIYYEYFLNAAKAANVSPYLLASRCLQEVGREGSSTTKGEYPGYEGYYNFFNIGASANADGSGAVANALKYAKEKGWDSPQKSIIGGAEFLGKNYIAKGQDTFYFQKFDVVDGGNGYYSHQYMQNLSAASTEGASYQKIYEDWTNAAIAYRIPVYENMPEEAAPLPTGVTNNYNRLSSLMVNGREIENFDGERMMYEITLTDGLVEFKADCPMRTAKVWTPETIIFTTGNFEKKIVVTAEDGSEREYSLYITVGAREQKGDVNGDGSVNSADALEVLRAEVGIYTLEGEGSTCLDVNGDGKADSGDALSILRFEVGVIDKFS